MKSSTLNKEIVFLLGFMGVGKTYVARNVSNALKWEHWDLDQVIEAGAGKKITDIFEESGEEGFRILERHALESLITNHNHVIISTGGGAPCFSDNIDLMNNVGFTIYISKPVENLVKNLLNGMTKRPLLASMRPQELQTYVREKLAERQKYYRQADSIVHDYYDQELITIISTKIRSKFNLK